MTILETQVTQYLTNQTGTAPTPAQLANALVNPFILSLVALTLNSGQAILTVYPTDDLQAGIDSIGDTGGGTVNLTGTTYTLTADLVIPSNVKLVGVGSSGTIIDCAGSYQIQCIGTAVYNTGTVTVANGDTTVVGTGTSWDASIEGESIFLQGQWYLIDTDTNGTHLELSTPYLGTDLTTEAYTIAYPNTSVLLQGITVQNSSTDLVKVQYAFNPAFGDVDLTGGNSGMAIDTVAILNYRIGNITDNGDGITINNLSGFTISDLFLNTNTTSGITGTLVIGGVILNSTLDSIIGDAVSFTGSSNIGIDQISITNITGNGISIDSSSILSLTNGLIQNCSGDGLKLDNGVTTMQVSTMQFSDNTGFGVNVVDSGSTNNIFGLSNYDNNTAGNFDDNGTGTLIRSNIGVMDN